MTLLSPAQPPGPVVEVTGTPVADAVARAVDTPLRVLRVRPDGGQVAVGWPADLFPLAGHYPGFPIVPGVFLVETAQRAVRELCGPGLSAWTAIRSTRFLRPVFPGDDLLLDVICPVQQDGARIARCRLSVGPEPVAVTTLVFGGEEPVSAGPDPDPPVAAGPDLDVPADPAVAAGLDRDLTTVLPHRFPMLLVDRVETIVPGRRLSARKAVCAAEWVFAGAPTTAGYPWALVVESWCQAAGVLAAWERPNPDVRSGQVMLFGAISGIALGDPVRPGDVLTHHVELVRDLGDVLMLAGHAEVAGRTVMTAQRITMALRPAEELTPVGAGTAHRSESSNGETDDET